MRPIVNVGWTLCHEMLFYAIFAALICSKRRASIAAVSTVLALSAYNCLLAVPGPYWLHTWLFSPYNLEFASGCAAAWLSRYRVQWSLPVGLVYLALSWIYSSFGAFELGDGNPATMLCFFGLPYFLIVMGAASLERHDRFDPPAFFIRLGDASYSIYLCHFAIASALTSLMCRLPWPPPFIVAAVCVLSTAAGIAIFRLLEKPLLDWMKTKAVRRPSTKAQHILAPSGNSL